MRYLQIKKNLYLIEQFVNAQQSQKTHGALNHIWIYDRSGSMSGVMSQLCDDLIRKAKEIPVGDSLTLGWFSGRNEFNFMLKGFKITEKRDYKILEQTINKTRSTVGMTCFSEILVDTDTVIKDLSAISKNFALCFFSDGYPTVGPYEREQKDIFGAINKIAGRVASSLLVGYGDYYNKELMSQMAERFGGSMIHSENLPAFSIALDNFTKDARENGSKVSVQLEAMPGKDPLVFGINGNQINLYQLQDGGEKMASVDFIPTQASRDSLYLLTDQKPKGEEVKLAEGDLQRPTSRESIIRGVYAAANLLSQRTKTDTAMEVLATIGDKDMIDSVGNAFTNAEYGRAEAKLQEAVANPKRRFMQGIKLNYLPKEDAFCVLDAVKLLMQDDEAFFYPYNEAFEYKRIGAGSKVKAGYPDFVADKDKAKCALNKLNWNKSMLNLSVLANIPGHIALSGDYAKHGFSQIYPTFVWRNYALIKDGFLNVQHLPASFSEETFKVLKTEGVLPATAWYTEGATYTLDLTTIPVINRAIANGRTSASALCKKAYRELELQAMLKSLNYLHDQLDPEGKSKLGKGALSADQELYLETQGVGRNGFSPPVEKLPVTDFYMAKTFDIKMKGLSSLPSVKEVLEKSAKGGKLTPGALLVKSGLDHAGQHMTKSTKDSAKLTWLDEEIKALKQDLVAVRSDIQETKFAVILGKKWFDEFTSREKNVLTLGGVEYSLVVEEEKVEL